VGELVLYLACLVVTTPVIKIDKPIDIIAVYPAELDKYQIVAAAKSIEDGYAHSSSPIGLPTFDTRPRNR
jgi:hypothetical protein